MWITFQYDVGITFGLLWNYMWKLVESLVDYCSVAFESLEGHSQVSAVRIPLLGSFFGGTFIHALMNYSFINASIHYFMN